MDWLLYLIGLFWELLIFFWGLLLYKIENSCKIIEISTQICNKQDFLTLRCPQ